MREMSTSPLWLYTKRPPIMACKARNESCNRGDGQFFCIARTHQIGAASKRSRGKKSAGCEAKTITQREKREREGESEDLSYCTTIKPCITTCEQASVLSQTGGGAKRAKVRPGPLSDIRLAPRPRRVRCRASRSRLSRGHTLTHPLCQAAVHRAQSPPPYPSRLPYPSGVPACLVCCMYWDGGREQRAHSRATAPHHTRMSYMRLPYAYDARLLRMPGWCTTLWPLAPLSLSLSLSLKRTWSKGDSSEWSADINGESERERCVSPFDHYSLAPTFLVLSVVCY